MDMNKSGRIDQFLAKWTSRKLLVLAVATGFVPFAIITGDQWTALALGYIGIEGVADIATRWKHG